MQLYIEMPIHQLSLIKYPESLDRPGVMPEF